MRNKNNVRKNTDAHHEWLEKREGYDPASLELLSDTCSPYSLKPMTPLLEDAYEGLEGLFFGNHLRGRQKQIVALLLEGFTNQVEIAKQLNMRQGHVADELRKIGKKISKSIV